MSSDSEALMPQAFGIIDVRGNEFDLDIPPTSGEEYLRRVQLEARQVPSVVVAEIDSSKPVNKQTVGIRNTTSILRAPAGFSPSVATQNKQAADFALVRQNFNRYKARVKREKLAPAMNLPAMDEVDKWCHMCFGNYSPGDLHVTLSSDLDSNSSEYSNRSPIRSCDKNTLPVPPLLSIIAHMSQPTVVRVLEYHVNWFEVTGFTEQQGRWLYALLVNLEKPLVPEACSLLRNLARNCANLRATFESAADPLLSHLNLLITLVSRYFNQTDLADSG